LLKLEPEEELIKITKPHSASFLSSPTFLIGALILIMGISRGLFPNHVVIRIALTGAGLLLVGLSYLRRVSAYTFYFTNRRVVSQYSFIRKAYREIWYDKIMEVKVLQDLFGKVCGYADVWMYGYQNGWVVGRMRGVRLGDSYIVVNRAWKKQS
jgi:Bacterial PH domain